MSDLRYGIVLDGIEEAMRCIICQNPMHTDRGCDGNCQYNEAMYKRIMQELDSRIKRLPYDQPEPHWIPVTERLPEKSGEYLVTVKWVTGESDVDVYEYDARHKTWNDGESAGGERAVAWCNLPEPYKGVTEWE